MGALQNFLFLKNIIWALVDFMKLLACGNEKATCLLFTPIEFVTRLVKGTKLASVWVGPAGIFRLFADLTTSKMKDSLAQRKAIYVAQRAWLILEQEKARRLEADQVLHNPAADMYS